MDGPVSGDIAFFISNDAIRREMAGVRQHIS